MKVTYIGDFEGLPKREFQMQIKGLETVKRIEVFGSYGDEILISIDWADHIRKNTIDAKIVKVDFREKKEEGVIGIGLPLSFRLQYIKGDTEVLKKVLRCLFQ